MLYIIMTIGVISAGSAVVFIKAGTMDPIFLAAYRQLIAALITLPLFIRDAKSRDKAITLKDLSPSFLPGIFLGLHFITWIMGARMIPGGHGSLLVTMSPVFMPFLMYFMVGEKITLLEVIGSCLAIGGVIFLGIKDSGYSTEYLKGDATVITSMILLVLYLALGKRNRKKAPLWFYMVPVYLVGGILCLLTGFIRGGDPLPATVNDYISLFGLAVVCTVIGHTIYNYGMRKMRGQVVSLINLAQIIAATILSFLFLGEVPPGYFYPAAVIILSGPVIVILFDKSQTEE